MGLRRSGALNAVPWAATPIANASTDIGHGRVERRTIQVLPVPEELATRWACESDFWHTKTLRRKPPATAESPHLCELDTAARKKNVTSTGRAANDAKAAACCFPAAAPMVAKAIRQQAAHCAVLHHKTAEQ
jgi:hypothetical protein